MKSDVQVVVVGGGIVGSSILYWLAKFGWTNVTLESIKACYRQGYRLPESI